MTLAGAATVAPRGHGKAVEARLGKVWRGGVRLGGLGGECHGAERRGMARRFWFGTARHRKPRRVMVRRSR
jgi:hypothetical protein